MKSSSIFLILLVGIIGILPLSTPGQTVVLVKDINFGSFDANPEHFTSTNNILYFAAQDVNSGIELWRSDGTHSGTYLVKNIADAPATSSNPENLYVWQGKIYFSATDGVNGRELWISDGSSEGTVMLKDIHPTNSSSPANFLSLNSTLYFSADDGVNGREIWKTDGTSSGTVMLKDIHPTGSSDPSEFINFNNSLVFTASDNQSGRELWISNGQTNGTLLLKDIQTGAGSSDPHDIYFAAGAICFAADDGLNGIELWTSDGTQNGTHLVTDINPLGDSNPTEFINMQNKLYFSADNGQNGTELWVSDGTIAGTQMVLDLNPGVDPGTNEPYSSFPAELTLLNNKMLFRATTQAEGSELWQTNGTSAGTQLLFSFRPSTPSGNPSFLYSLEDTVYFQANSTNFGIESWMSSGTMASTNVLTDLHPGSTNSSNPRNFFYCNGDIYFVADNGVTGRELWKVNYNCSPGHIFADPPRICIGDSTDLNIEGAEDMIPIQWQVFQSGNWVDLNTTPTTQTSFTLAPSSTGFYRAKLHCQSGSVLYTDEFLVSVDNYPLPPVIGVNGPFCINDDPAILDVSPTDGIWTGPGMDGNTFTPSLAGEGIHSFSFETFLGVGCGTASSTEIEVYGLPNATITQLGPFCPKDSAVELLAGSMGGNWSGSGVENGYFHPEAGTGLHTIVYFVSDVNGCENTGVLDFEVLPQPQVTALTMDTSCVDSGETVLLEGVPVGGTWSGLGVNGNVFSADDAETGAHVISYSVTDSNGCSNTDQTILIVEKCLGPVGISEELMKWSIYPNPVQTFLIVDWQKKDQLTKLEVLNSLGSLIPIHLEKLTETRSRLDLSSLAGGIYQLKLYYSDQIVSRKIVKH